MLEFLSSLVFVVIRIDRSPWRYSCLYVTINMSSLNCSTFQESLTCLRNIREQCPRTSTAFMDALVEPYVPVHELCVLPEFYERM